MPSISRFSAPRASQIPSARSVPQETQFDMRGLDLTNPPDLIKDGRSPYAKNFRLYSEVEGDRRVAISTRKGHGQYVPALFTTANVSNTSTTGASDQPVGVVQNWRAMPFTPNAGGRLSKVELNMRKGTGLSQVVVQIHTDNAGVPSTKMLAQTTILSSSITDTYDYVAARFIEAPLLENGTTYWIVVYVQDDGADGYEWSSNTATTLSMVSNAGVSGMQATTFSLNFKTYLSPDYKDKGATRFAQPFGVNRTLVAYETSMYVIDDTTGEATSIIDNLNSLATNYHFSFGDGKVFWVNGYDNLMAWDGTFPSDNTNVIANGDFETNATGWSSTGAATGGAVARVTSDFHAGVASLAVTATGAGTRQTTTTLSTAARSGSIQRVDFWIKTTAGQTITYGLEGHTQATVTATGSWQQIVQDVRVTSSATTFFVGTDTANFNIDEVKVRSSGVEQIIDAELPILSLFTFHKDRAWGVSASDPNKLVFSENPGNPSDAADQYGQWYYAWLSVSFIYVPVPKAADAITGLQSFQDVLKIFTYTNKYDLYGTDRGSLTLRQSTGAKGAVSQSGILADENFIYFVSSDGFYRHNGSSDEIISDYTSKGGGSIQPEFDGVAFPNNITVAKWKRQVRFYYGANGSPYNTDCVLWHTVFEEWQHDTEVNVNRGIFFGDGDDDKRLAEFSSLIPEIYNAEQDYNSLGKPIDFAYHMKYESNKAPAQRKRIVKFYPLMQGVDRSFVVNTDMDKDFADNPVLNQIILTSQGAVWGDFEWGDGTLWGSSNTFKPVKLRYPGFAYYWQFRISRKGANTPVYFFGVQYSYKAKRL